MFSSTDFSMKLPKWVRMYSLSTSANHKIAEPNAFVSATKKTEGRLDKKQFLFDI